MYKILATVSKSHWFVFFESEEGERRIMRNPETNSILYYTAKKDAEFLAKILNKAV